MKLFAFAASGPAGMLMRWHVGWNPTMMAYPLWRKPRWLWTTCSRFRKLQRSCRSVLGATPQGQKSAFYSAKSCAELLSRLVREVSAIVRDFDRRTFCPRQKSVRGSQTYRFGKVFCPRLCPRALVGNIFSKHVSAQVSAIVTCIKCSPIHLSAAPDLNL